MKTLVIYTSETGFTKQYVDMLEKRLNNPIICELKEMNKQDVKDADFIFYGGPLKNNSIKGLDKFLKYNKYFVNKDIFIFCTGMEPITDDKREMVIMVNNLDSYHVRLYLLPGGMDLSKMGAMKRKIIEYALKKSGSSGQIPEGVTPELIEERLKYPVNMVDPNAIERMLHVYNVLFGRKASYGKDI